jgi:PPOX class probable F420-dependent enzyme
MATMTDAERDGFLLERRLGTLAITRAGKGPLQAPIWFRWTPGGTVDICMGSDSAKARLLRASGRASMAVVDEGFPYRYVTVEGPVTVEPLGDATEAEILAMATRYLGEKGGARYTENFMANLVSDDLHPDHGTTEVIVRLTPERWRTEVLG